MGRARGRQCLWLVLALALPALALRGGVAAAQPAAPGAGTGAGDVPACAMLDRADGQSRVGVDLGYLHFAGGGTFGEADLTAFHLDLHGQYVLPSGLGAYAILPVSYAKLSFMGMSESDTSIGNVELGGVYRMPAGRGLDLAVHAGVTLPTAPSVDLGTFDGFANFAGFYARPNDLVLTAPEISYVRLGATPLFRQGQLFLRADASVDIGIHDGNGDAGDLPKIGHVNLAGGLALPQVALLGELVNVINLEFDDPDDDNVLHFVGATGRYTGGQVQPSISVLFPLDESTRDQVDVAIIAGVVAAIPN